MNLTLFFVFLTFASGLFLLLSGVMRLPTLKTSKVMMDTGREGKKLSKTLDALFLDGAVRLSPYIRINDYKRSRMNSVLKASGMGMTPEIYTAYAYIKAGSVFLLMIPALYIFPLAALFVILLGIMVYYREIQKADEMLRGKREQIEEELYRFVSTITQELKGNHVAVGIKGLSHCRNHYFILCVCVRLYRGVVPVSHRRSLCFPDHTGGGYDHYGFYPVCLCLFFHGSAAI